MAKLRLPKSYYLRRAVACYERIGDAYGAAEVLAAGELTDITEAARRFAALGDLPAAAEAYLAAGQPRPALDCFRRARLPEGELRCLLALGDDAQAGMLLLDMERPHEAAPPLERALATVSDAVVQAMLGLHLSRALLLSGQEEAGQHHYRAALETLLRLPVTAASTDAWVALGAWGAAARRQDRMQEGYAQALRLLEQSGKIERWQEVARRYQEAARQFDNRRLVQMLEGQRSKLAPAPTPAVAAPDPARALLQEQRWEDALALLKQQVDTHATAEALPDLVRVLLAELTESIAAPLALRLRAAETLATIGDPRLLDPYSGDSLISSLNYDAQIETLSSYWCGVEGGPFWCGDDRKEALRQMSLPYPFWIGRYAVTNAEFARFMQDGGYTTQRWWSEYGWLQCQEEGWEIPRFFDDEQFNLPNQPVVGISWYEAMAYCAWLTAQGHSYGWLPPDATIRLPTSLEWERAIRHTDQRRYAWGDTEPDPERANYDAANLIGPAPIGCFPAGAAVCGALDMAGNVQEGLATAWNEPYDLQPIRDLEPFQTGVRTHGDYRDSKELLYCGYRGWFYPASSDGDRGFRVVWV
jgi:formylglycine-generating enzyme required for sulfatase activity